MLKYFLPGDYAERVYAGVLGKIIGVYLGRPFEGWSYERIMHELGEVSYYVHEKLGKPLVVTDDDISGTFTFLRALPDYDYDPELTARQIGQTWLNYLIEERTILWWGGLGNSTEHTAYLRLKQGIPAPRSGSIELNSKVVAEQIGAQIFIDGWAMVAPGQPALAAKLAGQAGSVSHDGEAVYAAQVLAAMEAQAFVESDIQQLLDCGLSFIPEDSIISRMIQDIRQWHREEPDWRRARARLAEKYGYDIYGGNCHVIPNHGLIILALLYGNDNFQHSLMIVNTCGWDTDCNSGNLACLLGIKNGLRSLAEGPDWRGPIADRLYLPTAEGGRAITDAVIESYYIIKAGHALADLPFTAPKNGARFHFSLPGSVQGFELENAEQHEETVLIKNELRSDGQRALAIVLNMPNETSPVRIETATFTPPEALNMQGYALVGSPTLYAGQDVRAHIIANEENGQAMQVRLFIRMYAAGDMLSLIYGPEVTLAPGEEETLTWHLPDIQGQPIASIGLELPEVQTRQGSVYLDYLSWNGTPEITFAPPKTSGTAWLKAWVNGADQFEGGRLEEAYRVIQNHGRGLVIQGTCEWENYNVSATLRPHMANAVGLCARVQGMQRYYALVLKQNGQAQLIKMLDGESILAETSFPWEYDRSYVFSLQVVGNGLQAFIDGTLLFTLKVHERPLKSGSIALLCEEGRLDCLNVSVAPFYK